MSTTLDRSNMDMSPMGYGTISSTRSGYSIDGGTQRRQPRSKDNKNSMSDKMAANMGCFKFNYALVSRIATSFQDESTFDKLVDSEIDIDKARAEHEALVDALRHMDLDVIELPCDEKHPDGVFVDDIAVVINGTALICNPKTVANKCSRQGELAVVRQVLRKELGLKIAEVDSEKAYLEGGDVLWTGREIFVGISDRTNELGAQSVARAFPEYPTVIVKVHKPNVHLKSAISMGGPEMLVVANTESAQKTFKEMRKAGSDGYKYITVEEELAANVIFANKLMIHLTSKQIPKSIGILENKIDKRVAVDLEEALKRNARLGSCVLLVSRPKNPKKFPSTLP